MRIGRMRGRRGVLVRRIVVMGIFEVEYDEMGFIWLYMSIKGKLALTIGLEAVVSHLICS